MSARKRTHFLGAGVLRNRLAASRLSGDCLPFLDLGWERARWAALVPAVLCVSGNDSGLEPRRLRGADSEGQLDTVRLLFGAGPTGLLLSVVWLGTVCRCTALGGLHLRWDRRLAWWFSVSLSAWLPSCSSVAPTFHSPPGARGPTFLRVLRWAAPLVFGVTAIAILLGGAASLEVLFAFV